VFPSGVAQRDDAQLLAAIASAEAWPGVIKLAQEKRASLAFRTASRSACRCVGRLSRRYDVVTTFDVVHDADFRVYQLLTVDGEPAGSRLVLLAVHQIV
jgi:hypothetical protein